MAKTATAPHDAADPNSPAAIPPACRRERLARALYDFANSGYTTVVLTTLFSAYFAEEIRRLYAGHAPT